MTRVRILGEENTEPNKLKPIEFIYLLATASVEDIEDLNFIEATSAPKDWQEITLIYKDYVFGFDLMFCNNPGLKQRAVILGHFNDGVLE